MPQPYPEPARAWYFSDEAREEHADLFWRAPVRLAGGIWRDVWRSDCTIRGGGTASSVLPVLAVHVWPGMRTPLKSDSGPLWTPWRHLSARRIARLAGVSTETVGRVLDRLAGLELLQRQRAPAPAHQGGPPRTLYRLAARLYPPDEREPFARIPAALFYSATWAVLPSAAARHLYVAIAMLDAVLDETSFAAAQNDVGLEATELIERARRRRPLSHAQLAEGTGLQRSTLQEALSILTHPIFGQPATIPLVVSGPAEDGQGARWYAPSRVALTWYWRPEAVNTTAAIASAQAGTWPEIAQRRAAAKRRREAADWKAETKRRQEAAKRAAETRRQRAAERQGLPWKP